MFGTRASPLLLPPQQITSGAVEVPQIWVPPTLIWLKVSPFTGEPSKQSAAPSESIAHDPAAPLLTEMKVPVGR
jgi:hypothetical protein